MKNYEVNVVINGRKADVYLDPQSLKDLYIEGRDKSTYQIELKNNTWAQAEFVISVDGLSIIDGKPASKYSNGYVVEGKSSVLIDGWLVDAHTAAKFTFGTDENSYSEKSGNGTNNVGVIGALVFAKRVEMATNWNTVLRGVPLSPSIWDSTLNWNTSDVIGSNITGSLGPDVGPTVQSAASSNPYYGLVGSASTTGPALGSFEHPEEISSLGTEFGEATEMKTSKVNFVRASSIPVFEQTLHYNSAKELNKIGIVLKWQTPVERVKPQPFPADYCNPPTGWVKKG